MHGLTEEDSRRLIYDLREENRSLLAENRALKEELAAGSITATAAERARIRRELLAGLTVTPGMTALEMAILIDRIIPEEG